VTLSCPRTLAERGAGLQRLQPASGKGSSATAAAIGPVAAVVVAYRPDLNALCRNLTSLAPQVDRRIIIVNGGLDAPAGVLLRAVLGADDVLEISAVNQGLAAAQNQGIRLAVAAGAGAVLLLDQDSAPTPGMVAALAAALARLQRSGLRPAAVGPSHAAPGRDGGHWPGFVRIRPWGMARIKATRPEQPVACDFLIASGSLIPVPVIAAVGLMRAELFIDHVDTEWCLRAQAAGYQCYGLEAARLDHQLGERRLRLWAGRWRQIALHRPERYYFMLRNSLWLYRERNVRWDWKLADVLRTLRLFALMGMVGSERREFWSWVLRALRDGRRSGLPPPEWPPGTPPGPDG
jgi:rhamnosyltransferase